MADLCPWNIESVCLLCAESTSSQKHDESLLSGIADHKEGMYLNYFGILGLSNYLRRCGCL
jgi:hypothetical protein